MCRTRYTNFKHPQLNSMEQIIPPVDKELLKAELTPDKRLRMTNKSHNQIFVVDIHDSPNVVREIGRQREEVFREAGEAQKT